MDKRAKKLRRLSRPFRHALAYYFINLLLSLVKYLPLTWSQSLGRMIGMLCSITLRKQTRLIRKQLSHTLYRSSFTASTSPDFSIDSPPPINSAPLISLQPSELTRLQRRHWMDLGQRLLEWFNARQALTLFKLSPRHRIQLKRIQDQAKVGRAQIILSAHFAHWELMAAFLSHQGFNYLAVASALPKGPFGAWLGTYRKELGIKIIHPNGGAKQIKQALQEGIVIALLIDHSTHERSIETDFLGQKAYLSLTADRLITRFNAHVHWLSNYRDKEGNYQIILQDLSQSDQDFTEDEQNLESKLKLDANENVLTAHSDSLEEQKRRTASYTILAHQALEKQIQKWPEQWLWLHQKWTARQDHQ